MIFDFAVSNVSGDRSVAGGTRWDASLAAASASMWPGELLGTCLKMMWLLSWSIFFLTHATLLFLTDVLLNEAIAAAQSVLMTMVFAVVWAITQSIAILMAITSESNADVPGEFVLSILMGPSWFWRIIAADPLPF